MDDESPAELQFDRVEVAATAATGAMCSVCQSPIATEYYDINSRVVCESCRAGLELAVEGTKGVGPLLRAGFLGLMAALLGAVVYYAVIAIAHLEVGLIAILCGYMVGFAVRRGS